MIDERTESLARYLARAAGWNTPGFDEETPVTSYQPQLATAPQHVYIVPREHCPVWRMYVNTAKAALEWVEKSSTIPK